MQGIKRILTIKNNKIENEFYFNRVFIEKSFKYYLSDPWESVSKEAAEWLYRVWKIYFYNKQIYFFGLRAHWLIIE